MNNCRFPNFRLHTLQNCFNHHLSSASRTQADDFGVKALSMYRYQSVLGSSHNPCRGNSRNSPCFRRFFHARKCGFQSELNKVGVKDSLIFPNLCFFVMMSRPQVSRKPNFIWGRPSFAGRHPTSHNLRKWKRQNPGKLPEFP